MTTKKKLVIIGGGPAGIAAASAADTRSTDVTLISNAPLGGRAGWHSLLPSKVLLTASDLLHHAGVDTPVYAEMMTEIERVADQYHSALQDDLEARGVHILMGTARFTGPHTLDVTTAADEALSLPFDYAVVASGSGPIFPPGLKPDGQRIWAPRFVKHRHTMPESIIVVGGGVTGTEFVYAFNSLGIEVTWLVDEFGVLPPFARDITHSLVETLLARGVELVEGVPVAELKSAETGVSATLKDGRAFTADESFVAIGRRPDLANLNLEAAGFAGGLRELAVDECARTAVDHIYAAGDVTGAPLVVNKAVAQAWTGARHATGVQTPPLKPSTWVEAVYTHPQVAQVGLTAERAAAENRPVNVQRVEAREALKNLLVSDEGGFVTLVSDPETERVLGGSAVGGHAADLLAPIALAIGVGATVSDLAAIFPAHPTLSELSFEGARRQM
jgi:dihydrolipoamide dehydrogenase